MVRAGPGSNAPVEGLGSEDTVPIIWSKMWNHCTIFHRFPVENLGFNEYKSLDSMFCKHKIQKKFWRFNGGLHSSGYASDNDNNILADLSLHAHWSASLWVTTDGWVQKWYGRRGGQRAGARCRAVVDIDMCLMYGQPMTRLNVFDDQAMIQTRTARGPLADQIKSNQIKLFYSAPKSWPESWPT